MQGRTTAWVIGLAMLCGTAGLADDPGDDVIATNAEAGAVRAATNVALVDLAHVFANSDGFNAGKAELQERVKMLEAQGKTMARIVADLEKSVEKAEAGSLERDRRERDALEAKRQLEDFQRTAKGNLLRSEATLYREEYGRIRRAIREYAREHGIVLVLRYQRVNLDEASDPKKIINAVTRNVLYTDDGLDVTEDILARINDEHANEAAE